MSTPSWPASARGRHCLCGCQLVTPKTVGYDQVMVGRAINIDCIVFWRALSNSSFVHMCVNVNICKDSCRTMGHPNKSISEK